VQFIYSAFGLQLHSNVPIPGLVALSARSGVGLRLWLGLKPSWLKEKQQVRSELWYVSPYKIEGGQPKLMVWKLGSTDLVHLLYGEGAEFIIDLAGGEIWATWSEELTLEDAATFLLGPVLGFVLRLRGVTCLHASAVVIEGRTVVFIGKAGAGKSTTAAAFTKQGYRVLSDDIVALAEQDNTFLVQPAYPRIRLWSKSVDILYGKPDALPRIVPTHPTWDKRYLDPTGGLQFQEEPLPLRAIYVLGSRTSEPAAPYIEPVPTQQALISLIANTYANILLDKEMRTEEFKCLSQVVGLVPVRRVRAHADPAYLPELCDVIVEDFQNINTAKIA